MITTILFDLDGTLIPMKQDDFVKHYFEKLVRKMVPYGLEKDALIQAVWEGTNAMVKNNGQTKNVQVFWEYFAKRLGEDVLKLEPVFASFYEKEFDGVKEVVQPTELSKEIIQSLRKKGYTLILATNPLFPPVAIRTRLGWVGLTLEDFDYVTTYENSSYCKPNLDYYKEILDVNKKLPKECLMIGNNMVEDMCAAQLGMQTYLVTDFIEDGEGRDISKYQHGGLIQLKDWLAKSY